MWLDPDHHGNTPLHVACAHGNLDALQQGFFKRDIWLVKGDGGQLGSDGGSEAPSDVRSDVEGSDAEGSGTGDQEVRIFTTHEYIDSDPDRTTS